MKKGYETLSQKYRFEREGKRPYELTQEEVDAYVEARFPATFAACAAVLSSLHKLSLPLSFSTLADMGAGPATATLAALSLFPETIESFLVERDPKMEEKARKAILDMFGEGEKKSLHFLCEDMALGNVSLGKKTIDLCLFSYSLGELEHVARDRIIECVCTWKNAQGETPLIVVIEPGTPKGFEVILQAKRILLESGMQIVAPCCSEEGFLQTTCPLEKGKQHGWGFCHFGVKLNRSSRHRYLKGGSVNWEEEKYSYLICAPKSLRLSAGSSFRLISPPKKERHATLGLACSCRRGIFPYTISKKSEHGKEAKKWKWGDRVTFKDLS